LLIRTVHANEAQKPRSVEAAIYRPTDMNEAAADLSSAPATSGRISIASFDEHKTGSIESVPKNDQDNPLCCRSIACVDDGSGAKVSAIRLDLLTHSLIRNKNFHIAKRIEIGRFSANNGRHQGPGMLSAGPRTALQTGPAATSPFVVRWQSTISAPTLAALVAQPIARHRGGAAACRCRRRRRFHARARKNLRSAWCQPRLA